MTNNDINITITLLYLCQEDIAEKYKNLQNDEVVSNSFKLHKEHFYSAHRKGKHMEKKDVRLEDAVKYMKWMFDKTGQKYSCTRIKLAKLLAISAFKYARDNIQLFKEDVYKYKNCGAVIESMNATADMATYVKFQYEDGLIYINEDLTPDENIKIETETLDDEIRNNLEKVFRTFGALSAEMLGTCLSAIVNIEGISTDNGKINLEKIGLLKWEDFPEKDKENKLINFLLES